jgi:RNA polymerase sigma-70 factor (ECF subfamily)
MIKNIFLDKTMDFDEIYRLYAPQVFRVCMGYTNDYEQARDLTQETFIAVWQNLSLFRNQSKISTWIFRIATNNCLRAHEKASRGRLTELPPGMQTPPDESPEAREAEKARQEKLRFLYACIAEMEETERIVISLVLEDLPQADIASIVGLTAANTRVKIHRIKERLSAKFRHHGQFE